MPVTAGTHLRRRATTRRTATTRRRPATSTTGHQHPAPSVDPAGSTATATASPIQSYLNYELLRRRRLHHGRRRPARGDHGHPRRRCDRVTADSSVTATFDRAITDEHPGPDGHRRGGQLVGGQADLRRRRVVERTFAHRAPLRRRHTYTAVGRRRQRVRGGHAEREDVDLHHGGRTPPTVTTCQPGRRRRSTSPPRPSPVTRDLDPATSSSRLGGVDAQDASSGRGRRHDHLRRRRPPGGDFTPAAPLDRSTPSTRPPVTRRAPRAASPWPRLVDVAASPRPDPTAPTVTVHDARRPEPPASTVTAAVTATFARAVDPATLQVGLRTRAGVGVAGDHHLRRRHPRRHLHARRRPWRVRRPTRRRATASNTSGVPMASPRTWSFTTADVDPPGRDRPYPGRRRHRPSTADDQRDRHLRPRRSPRRQLTLTLRTASGTSSHREHDLQHDDPDGHLQPDGRPDSARPAYTASVTARSAPGVAMPAPATWSFTTAAQAFSLYSTATPSTPVSPAPRPRPTTRRRAVLLEPRRAGDRDPVLRHGREHRQHRQALERATARSSGHRDHHRRPAPAGARPPSRRPVPDHRRHQLRRVLLRPGRTVVLDHASGYARQLHRGPADACRPPAGGPARRYVFPGRPPADQLLGRRPRVASEPRRPTTAPPVCSQEEQPCVRSPSSAPATGDRIWSATSAPARTGTWSRSATSTRRAPARSSAPGRPSRSRPRSSGCWPATTSTPSPSPPRPAPTRRSPWPPSRPASTCWWRSRWPTTPRPPR